MLGDWPKDAIIGPTGIRKTVKFLLLLNGQVNQRAQRWTSLADIAVDTLVRTGTFLWGHEMPPQKRPNQCDCRYTGCSKSDRGRSPSITPSPHDTRTFFVNTATTPFG
ncbi:MAG: hypothetical protein F6K30_18225 [Cyanothece sp. SIO2G6]|nr:hypothetical protein [Cyanothece sp. SIO2G6]